ncbi:MAG: hypothetical protein ABH814_01625 [bacterium]
MANRIVFTKATMMDRILEQLGNGVMSGANIKRAILEEEGFNGLFEAALTRLKEDYLVIDWDVTGNLLKLP